jgi:hypothetical protein
MPLLVVLVVKLPQSGQCIFTDRTILKIKAAMNSKMINIDISFIQSLFYKILINKYLIKKNVLNETT